MPKQMIYVAEAPGGGEYRVDAKGNLVNNGTIVVKSENLREFRDWLSEEINRVHFGKTAGGYRQDPLG